MTSHLPECPGDSCVCSAVRSAYRRGYNDGVRVRFLGDWLFGRRAKSTMCGPTEWQLDMPVYVGDEE